MNSFNEWFKSEMPNTYAKKDSEKIEALVYSVALAAWNVQQAEIDAALKQRDSFIKAHHISMDDVCKMKAERDALQAKLNRIKNLCNEEIKDYRESKPSSFSEHDRGYFNACCQVSNIINDK